MAEIKINPKFALRRIAELKKEAKQLYLSYHSQYEAYDHMGKNLAEYISVDLRATAVEFNRVMDELRSLDPSAPSTRL